MTEKIELVNGDMFRSSMQTIVITVNCKGVMGKGIALYIKKNVPQAYEKYKKLCELGEIRIGKLAIYDEELPELQSEDGFKKLLFFPTKIHWRNKSDLLHIREGLEYFVEHYSELGIESAAFPALGCGYGGLSWSGVYPLMTKYLENVKIPIEIYPPQEKQSGEKTQNLTKRKSDVRITDF